LIGADMMIATPLDRGTEVKLAVPVDNGGLS
jgi:hypothetical protein